MEQQDFTPIGGSWQQDAAYSLRQLIVQANELLIKIEENGNAITSGLTQSETNILDAINEQQTIVEVTSYTVVPRDTIYVNNPLPIVTPKPKQQIVYKKEIIKPAPLVIDIARRNAYSRVCGGFPEPDCKRCVDAWLDARPDGFELKDLTSTGTGCRYIRQIHQAVRP